MTVVLKTFRACMNCAKEILVPDLFRNAGTLEHQQKQTARACDAEHDSLFGQLRSQ